MIKRLVIVGFVALFVFAGSPAQAEERPVQLSLFNPIQLFSEGDSIKGLRLNLIYGKNTTVTGLDWGLINHTTTGLSKGWQHGLVNLTEEDFLGFQEGAVNVVRGSIEGLQMGIVNHSHHASGVQLGLVNYAETLHGIQIGLINIISQGGVFPVLPIVNWSF